jgi:hypothetical protein
MVEKKRSRPVHTAPELLMKLKRGHSDKTGAVRTWAEVAKIVSERGRHPVSTAYVYQIAQGRKPAPNYVLLALKLPLRPVLAPPCRKCGKVHVRKTCPERSKPRGYKSLNDLRDEQIVAMFRYRREYNP